jgi:hypothetical protein
MLEFDEENHIYHVDGKVYPSVTQIIKPLYSFDGIDSGVLEYAAARGRAVHKAVELWNANDLDESTLDPVLVPYLEAYKKFATEMKFTATHSERHLAHPSMHYAGTPDIEGKINEGKHKGEWLVDLKAVAVLHASAGVQLAAYANLIGKPSIRRAAVQLKPTGKYLFEEYPSKADWPTFVACLTVHNFRENNHVT